VRDFPPPTQYAKMLSTPQSIRLAFKDPALKSATVETDARQMPRVRSGAFAVVYKMTQPNGQSRAVRLFLKDGDDRRERYAIINEHLARSPLSCLVSFAYSDDGFRAADGNRYPMMTMDWVTGDTLFDWLNARASQGDGKAIAAVAAKWRGTVSELRRAGIAHGDLQHANVMVTPTGHLKLVDYDGMCVPELVGRRNLEIGVEPYQHPGRNGDTMLSPALDNFSSIVLQTGLSALAAEPNLWQEFVIKPANEKILFRREDFDDPAKSPLFARLRRSPDPQVHVLAAAIAALWSARIDQVPSLEDLLGTFDFGQVRSALDRRDFDASVVLLERYGKKEADAPLDMRPRIRDATHRTNKLTELVRAIDAGDEAAIPALAASPLLRDYPAAAQSLAMARDAAVVATIIGKLDAALRARRGRDLVREWNAAQPVLTRPTGRLRKSATRFVRDVQQWQARNEACDKVLAYLRAPKSDEPSLAAAWRELEALGGHPECDAFRTRVQTILGSQRSIGSTVAVPPHGVKAPVTATVPVAAPGSRLSSPAGSRSASVPASAAASVVVSSATGSRPAGASRAAVAVPVPSSVQPVNPGTAGRQVSPLSSAAASSGHVSASPSQRSGLSVAAGVFLRELGIVIADLAWRWIPLCRWVAGRTSSWRVDRDSSWMGCVLARGAFVGALVGSGLAQVACYFLAKREPSGYQPIEWLVWLGTMILCQVSMPAVGAALGITASRNRLSQRPSWRLRGVVWAIAAGFSGGLVAALVAAGLARFFGQPDSWTGGDTLSWSFLGGFFLVVSAGVTALACFSSRSVPNVSRTGLVISVVAASLLATIVMRIFGASLVSLQWLAVMAAAAVGSAVFAGGLAMAEAMAACPFLEVQRNRRREQRLNLGSTPVMLGSDGARCDVVVPGQLPVACRLWLDAGQIYVLEYATGQPMRVGVGDQRTFGSVTVVVHAAGMRQSTTGNGTGGNPPPWGAAGGSRPAMFGGTTTSVSLRAGAVSTGSRSARGVPPPPPLRPQAPP